VAIDTTSNRRNSMPDKPKSDIQKIMDKLELKDQDLGTTEDKPGFEPHDDEPQTASLSEWQEELERQQYIKDHTPRHLMRKSLGVEKEQWRDEILPSPHDSIAFRVPSKKHGGIKRTKLYHARTALHATGDYDEGELMRWSFSVEEHKTIWYVVGRRLIQLSGVHIAEFD
jgi:hypothetical protein